MERNRPSVIRRPEHMVWHTANRKTLQPKTTIKIQLTRKETELRIRDRENVIYDIQPGYPSELRQKLQIRHKTGER